MFLFMEKKKYFTLRNFHIIYVFSKSEFWLNFHFIKKKNIFASFFVSSKRQKTKLSTSICTFRKFKEKKKKDFIIFFSTSWFSFIKYVSWKYVSSRFCKNLHAGNKCMINPWIHLKFHYGIPSLFLSFLKKKKKTW